MTNRKAAEQFVKRGMDWLDENVPEWSERIRLDTLDLGYPCKCVLGQLDGDFYESVWRHHLSRDEAQQLGFTRSGAITFRTLTAVWRAAVKAKIVAAKT